MVKYFVAASQSYFFWGTLGIILCYPLALYNLNKIRIPFIKSLVIITVGIYGGLFGGRILYIALFHPQLFFENPLLAISFWKQTGTWLGAPIGVFICLYFTIRAMHIDFFTCIGSFTPSMILAHGISRMGCLMAGCCHGSSTEVFWAIYSEKLNTNVHPTSLYSALGEFISFLILQNLWKEEKYRQYIFPLYLVILSIHRFISEFFRGSDIGNSPIPGLRIFQVVCIALFLIGIFLIIIIKNQFHFDYKSENNSATTHKVGGSNEVQGRHPGIKSKKEQPVV